MNILFVEDNDTIVKGLKYSFEKQNYNLIHCSCQKEARALLESTSDIDLAILDVTLPDGNGFSLYKNVVKPLGIPALFLTARDFEDDIVEGLSMGAEDYITKPFSTKELLVRIKKIILRTKRCSVIKVGDITFDADKMTVKKDDIVIDFTSLEIKILSLFFFSLGKVVSRDTILDKIWEWTGNDVDDHTVTVYLKRIREKLGSDIITTVKGLGYRIDEK